LAHKFADVARNLMTTTNVDVRQQLRRFWPLPAAAIRDTLTWRRGSGRSVARIDGETASSAVGEPARRETGHFRNYREHRGTRSATLPRKAV
jgi:hypothetical protein